MFGSTKKGRDKQEGFLSYVEVAGNVMSKINGNLRLQYFETGSYDSRIYTYESDVLYSYSIPAFYDKDFRYYINTSYSPFKNLTLWMRLAQTYYPQKLIVGTGLNEISGKSQSKLKLQVKYDF